MPWLTGLTMPVLVTGYAGGGQLAGKVEKWSGGGKEGWDRGEQELNVYTVRKG